MTRAWGFVSGARANQITVDTLLARQMLQKVQRLGEYEAILTVSYEPLGRYARR